MEVTKSVKHEVVFDIKDGQGKAVINDGVLDYAIISAKGENVLNAYNIEFLKDVHKSLGNLITLIEKG